MPLLSEQLPNLMNGVSQQAITMRQASQCEAQVNGFSSVVEGVNKRPPTKHVAKVIDGLPGEAYTFTIDRDSEEQYSVVVTDGQLRVFDMAGGAKTVNAPSGYGYIASPTPLTDLRAITINDSTFITNVNKVVTKLPDVTAARSKKTIIFIKGVNYGVDWEIKFNGVKAASTATPASTNAPKIATDDVALGLVTSLNAAGTGLDAVKDNYTITRNDNIIVLEHTGASTPGRWELFDSFSGIYSEVIGEEMTRFTDLPTTAPHGFEVKITGDISSDADDYYLRFETSDGSNSIAEGQWVETLAPGIQHKLDNSTMPHILTREADGSFTFGPVDWGERIVGDEETAAWPSFVGAKVNDIYFDRNRLCFLSGPNVSMSRARSLFEFFPTTVTTLLDDGPIDVTASGSKTSTLRSAVPFNKQVILFGDQTQFTIDVNLLLASEPPAVTVLTDYETDKQTVPVAVGKTLYFTVTRGGFTSVMEYYVVDDTEATDAADVTKHVPTYIPSGAFKLAASPTTDVVMALTKNDPNSVYIYKYYWNNREKLQSSWSKWEFADDAVILNVDFIKDEAVFVVQYPDGVYLQRMNVAEGQTDVDADFVYRLDRRVSEADCTVTYDGVTQNTSVVLPYIPSDPSKVLVASRPGGLSADPIGTTPEIVSVTGDTIVLRGDLELTNFYVGETYTFLYTFSEAVLKTAATGGGVATVTGGRLQLQKMYVTFARTGYFRAEVKADNRPAYVYPYSGKILGTSQAVIGVPTVGDGTFGFRVNSKSTKVKITLINDGFLPSYFTAAEWEGRYERRTGR